MSKSSSLTNNWLRYWRNSLADAESGKGSLKKEDLKKYLHLNVSSFQAGRIDAPSAVKKLFEDEDDKTQLVKIIVRPIVYHSKYEHGKLHKGVENNTLEDLVGIVTPFKAQQELIKTECRKQEINVDTMTIGTVHSLQGAERPIIIFSAVYSRHSDGKFIDMSPSMLNVAVSRARDSFIVFGDMDVISMASYGKPRNILAQYLFKSASHELIFALSKRPDLLSICTTPKLINNAVEHDRYLKQILDEAVDEISLVSPWVSLLKLKETGIYIGV